MASFLSPDGYINVPSFIELVRDIDKLAVEEQLKPGEVWYSKKAIVREDHPSAARLDAAAFEKKRAQEIKMRKRPAPSGQAVRMMVLLRSYKKLETFPEYYKDFQLALKAIERHNVKALKSITSLKTAAAKNRDKLNAAFDKNIDCFINKVLSEDAVENEDYVIGTSMMGKTLLIKLPNGGVMSVGKADLERFNKAVENNEAPAPTKTARAVKAPARGAVNKVATGRASTAKPARPTKPVSVPAPAKRVAKVEAKPAPRSAAMRPALKQKPVAAAGKRVQSLVKPTRR